jgi:hypothetical protein
LNVKLTAHFNIMAMSRIMEVQHCSSIRLHDVHTDKLCCTAAGATQCTMCCHDCPQSQ